MPDEPVPVSPPSASATREELPAPIRVLVTEEVQRLLDREHEKLFSVGGGVVKFLSIVVVVLSFIFTVLGIRTYYDVRGLAVGIVTRHVDSLVQRADSEHGVKQTLDDLINRSIVTASLLAEKRAALRQVDAGGAPSPSASAAAIALPLNEWMRLREWIKNENLALQDFSDTLAILAAQEDSRRGQDANLFLAEMLNPPADSRYRWIVHQPEKRLAILQTFEQAELGAAALGVARSDRNSEAMRIAAVRYIKKLHLLEEFDGLALMTDNARDDELSREALLACASLKPSHPKMAEAVQSLVSKDATYKSAKLAVELATGI